MIGKDLVTYRYTQPIPIAPYILAIAAGNVCYRLFPKPEDKEWTSGVWAEPELIDQAYWEFSEDTTRFLAAAEKLVIPYQFGVYDLLVLPPSFPYGGMENACLSFVTPTLLTGDRSLVDVVVHELTHSWFGNGVTQANASHFWLNEGWTTYIERVLLQVLYSPAERGFSFVIGSKALNDSLKQYEDRPKYQRLSISFEKGEDPDDAFSSIPYEKGANFLLHLECILGGLDIFLPYVKDYVETFIGKSITSEQWKEHLYA
jgi:leukotriene-A4 hydrolase